MKSTENEKTTKMHHFKKQNCPRRSMKIIYNTISMERTLCKIPQLNFLGGVGILSLCDEHFKETGVVKNTTPVPMKKRQKCTIFRSKIDNVDQ